MMNRLQKVTYGRDVIWRWCQSDLGEDELNIRIIKYPSVR